VACRDQVRHDERLRGFLRKLEALGPFAALRMAVPATCQLRARYVPGTKTRPLVFQLADDSRNGSTQLRGSLQSLALVNVSL
jgi:hypothetical protein